MNSSSADSPRDANAAMTSSSQHTSSQKNIALRVNGEHHAIQVSDRSQLAEVLRDRLHLTGTHLGCEQGICGACTVLVNGKPVRSCLMYAGTCDGVVVHTVEGLADDPIMDALRDAFSRHHALQCGFCTSGMLMSAYDLVSRLDTADETLVRQQLSGNLCRCTGYMGIVAAICEVISAQPNTKNTDKKNTDKGSEHTDARANSNAQPTAPPYPPLKPFEIDRRFTQVNASTDSPTSVTDSDGSTRIEHRFTVRHPLTTVWELFDDLPRLARCLPGAHIDDTPGSLSNDTALKGRLAIAFGPIKAGFDITGIRQKSIDTHSGTIVGTGLDRSSRSQAQGSLHYQCDTIDSQSTKVDIALAFSIQGPLAQFNRPDLVTSFSQIILQQFQQNVERMLDGQSDAIDSDLKGIAMVSSLIKRKIGI